MTLEEFGPAPDWNADEHGDEVAALATPGLSFKVWGGSWCGDCRRLLPPFAAALEAAGVPPERVDEYLVDDEKAGDLVEEYEVRFIPTVVVERDGEEIARFVEDEGMPIATYLAGRIRESDVTA